MQFKHPEILWALFLVLIPIVIHLFKLRKYQKEAFTNVQVLWEVRRQTNKQSQIKKWLILLTRILSTLCLVIAFAEPYLSKLDLKDHQVETVIYIDNSFSMQLQGTKGTLLQEAINEVLEQFPTTQTFSLLTNTETFKNTTIEEIKNNLIKTPYSNEQLSLEAIFRSSNRLFTQEVKVKNLLIFSDFQQRQLPENPPLEINTYFIPLQGMSTANTVIDSAYISLKTPEQHQITVLLSNNDDSTATPVTLYHNNEMYAKTSAEFKNNRATVTFNVDKEFTNGHISVNDKGMSYDNNLYFSINASVKINVLSINGSDDQFLQRIYTPDAFNYKSMPYNKLNYNGLSQQNLIILNQLPSLPNSLIAALEQACRDGVKICVIPDKNDYIISSQPLFPFLADLKFTKASSNQRHITTIKYQHPLFDNVFESQVANFEYPKVSNSFEIDGNYQSVLSYQDGNDFLVEVNGNYAFTAPLSTLSGNFQNSPLIVPVFFNMAQQSLPVATLYYQLGKPHTIAINTQLDQDQVLTLENTHESFIPLQVNHQNYISITTGEYPSMEGTYQVKNQQEKVLSLSFNYQRNESQQEYLSKADFHPEAIKSASQIFKQLKSENNINELWKWFAIFALFFLCLELLIQKYFK